MIRKNMQSGISTRYYSYITTLHFERIVSEYVHISCAAYIRDVPRKYALLVQAPVEWYENYDTIEEQKKWEAEIALLGGKAVFNGFEPYKGDKLGNVVKYMNNTMLGIYYYAPYEVDNKIFITKDEWAQWTIPADIPITQRYYTFCLIRYLYARHVSPIVDTYYEIRKDLPEIEPFKALQLAQLRYDRDTEIGFSPDLGYNVTWTCFDNTPRHLKSLELGKFTLSQEWVGTLQGRLCGLVYKGAIPVKELLLNGEYKKAYEVLNG